MEVWWLESYGTSSVHFWTNLGGTRKGENFHTASYHFANLGTNRVSDSSQPDICPLGSSEGGLFASSAGSEL
ncbi:MAG: hypothetical protein ACI9R3_001540 [Verrucomicrobiales bacterium]|jgi:hypothetical protein